MSDRDFINIGALNIKSHANRKYYQKLESIGNNTKSVLENGIDYLIPLMDKNFDYKILRSDNHSVVLMSTPNEHMCDMLEGAQFSTKEVALYRFGHYGSFPGYFGIDAPEFNKSTLSFDEKSGAVTYNFKFENRPIVTKQDGTDFEESLSRPSL